MKPIALAELFMFPLCPSPKYWVRLIIAPCWPLLAGAVLFSLAMPLRAQFQPVDYYLARATNSGPLQIAENLHLKKAELHMVAGTTASGRNRTFEYESAYKESKFILGQFPNHPQALLVAIDACSKWGSPLCTVDDLLQTALEINPKAAGTYVIQGIYSHRQQRYAEAIQSFKTALEIDPSSINAHYNLGLTYFEIKQYDRANDEAQQAYALGAPLSGLRLKLERAGKWKPQKQEAAKENGDSTETSPPAETTKRIPNN